MKESELVTLMDKIIRELHTSNLDTVPELLYGFQRYPSHNSREDLLCRVVEKLLVTNNLAALKTLEPNSRICGYYDLSLTPLAYELILSERSCEDVLKKGDISKGSHSIQIIFSCGENNIINTGNDNNFMS